MLSSEQFSSLLNQVMGQLGGQGDAASGKSSCHKDGGDDPKNRLSPSQLLVIAGILGGALEVAEIVITKNQDVQIRLDGSLRRKTELERTMDKIGGHSFDEVVKALMGRLT